MSDCRGLDFPLLAAEQAAVDCRVLVVCPVPAEALVAEVAACPVPAEEHQVLMAAVTVAVAAAQS